MHTFYAWEPWESYCHRNIELGRWSCQWCCRNVLENSCSRTPRDNSHSNLETNKIWGGGWIWPLKAHTSKILLVAKVLLDSYLAVLQECLLGYITAHFCWYRFNFYYDAGSVWDGNYVNLAYSSHHDSRATGLAWVRVLLLQPLSDLPFPSGPQLKNHSETELSLQLHVWSIKTSVVEMSSHCNAPPTSFFMLLMVAAPCIPSVLKVDLCSVI